MPAVTELIVSELLYMQYTDPGKACYLYINSTGCTRADGEVVGFETEATAIYDTMKYICLLYTSPSPRDRQKSRMPSSA